MTITRTHEELATIDPETGKVFVFVEPTDEIIEQYEGATPDEVDGAHCVSFVLGTDAITSAAVALCKEAHGA